MASCSEACAVASSSGGESSGSETGSSCLQFGVRSYLHHFYEECSASQWERDQEDQRFVQTQRSPRWWSSGSWKVSLALGLLILTAGLVSLSVGYSTPPRIESFGEGELLFVDTQAIGFNKALRLSVAAGIGLCSLGSGLAMVGFLLWLLPGANFKERLFHREERERETGGEWGTKGEVLVAPGEAVTKAPGTGEWKVPVTLSKVENIQPST